MRFGPLPGMFHSLGNVARTSVRPINRVLKLTTITKLINLPPKTLTLSLLALLVVVPLLTIGAIVYGEEYLHGGEAVHLSWESVPGSILQSVSTSTSAVDSIPKDAVQSGQNQGQSDKAGANQAGSVTSTGSEQKQPGLLASKVLNLVHFGARQADQKQSQQTDSNPNDRSTETNPDQKPPDQAVSSNDGSPAQETPAAVAAASIEPEKAIEPTPNASANSSTGDNLPTQDSSAADQKSSSGNDKSDSSRPALSARSGREEDEAKPAANPLSPEQQFISIVAEAARLSQQKTGVPASVTIAQAMLESNLGRSPLAREGNNYFGIKATAKPGPAGVVYEDTWEFVNGKDITVKEPFRAYHNMLESFIDHGLFIVENARYAAAMQNTSNPQLFAKLIQQAGYATDPNYSAKLIGLMDKFNLYAYDSSS